MGWGGLLFGTAVSEGEDEDEGVVRVWCQA